MTLFSEKKLTWLGQVLALILTAAAVLLHLFSFSVACGLWRDEVGLLNIAQLPSWSGIITVLTHDSFPILFPAVLRTWTSMGLAQSDTELRLLGLCAGLFLLASFWIASRMTSKTPPLLLLSVAALNPVLIRYGDSLRSYALGTAFIILTTGFIWRFVEKPNWRSGLLAGTLAVLSVQTLYQNAFLLLAICGAGAIVSLRQQQYAKVAAIFSIGLVAALSLMPYVKPIHEAQAWWVMSKFGTDWHTTFSRLSQLNGSLFSVWLVAMILAVVCGVGWIFLKPLKPEALKHADLPLFGGIALVLGLIGFGVFIKLSGLPTQVWYYVPLLCFTLLCCDCVFPSVNTRTRIVLLAVAVMALTLSPSAYSALRWRQTNGDVVAAELSKAVTADDFIIVHPWFYGVTFAHYYNGPAKWTTLPPLADYRFHRYDLIKEQLQNTNAIAPVLSQVRATLQSGHRVWIVGKISAPPVGSGKPAAMPAAPNGPSGWLDIPYYAAWSEQLGWYLQTHAAKVSFYEIEATNASPVNPLEKMNLNSFSGWNTNAPDSDR